MSASGTRVYVGRVPMDARDKDIEKFFKGYGRLREILMKNGYTFVVSLAEKLSWAISRQLRTTNIYSDMVFV